MKCSVQSIGHRAKAMDAVYKLASQGASSGTVACPRGCGDTAVKFTAGSQPHATTGRCSTPGCITWRTQ